MNTRSLVVASIISAFIPAAALAQSAAGTVGGCVAGAIIGGPVGCVIGAVIGGTIVPPPAVIVTYVTAQPAPAAVTLQGNLVVGATIPDTVVLVPVPATVYTPPAGATAVVYGYAFINGKRVVVDTKTHVIVAIVG